MAATIDRRAFLSGGGSCRPAPASRPPWTDEARIRGACTACGACVEACPEAILTRDADGRPALALDGGACSFCGACAEACPAPVFDSDRVPPWPVAAAVGGGCLLDLGIDCRICTDACDTEAIRFDPGRRPVGAVRVEPAACTGCGACVSVCPADAITLADPRRGPVAA